MFIQFAQQMESLGLNGRAGAIDIELVDRTLGSLVSTAWQKYELMFMDMREKTPDPYLAEYFPVVGRKNRQTASRQILANHSTNPKIIWLTAGTISEPFMLELSADLAGVLPKIS